ncbi:hypothetical protein [Cognatiyoonia koreensis]|uniref:hypothetical protein n=1 Tax=Cognatiyoonia koreensis TaxID=364200 RepID=UPI0013F4D375|nr:hypothetical protein [Cognatiyoonia koreensis]
MTHPPFQPRIPQKAALAVLKTSPIGAGNFSHGGQTAEEDRGYGGDHAGSERVPMAT